MTTIAMLRSFEILLVTKVLVGGEKDFVAFLLGDAEQIAVSQAVPSEVDGHADLMGSQIALDGKRRSPNRREPAFLKSVAGRLVEAANGELDHGFNLAPVKTREPLHDVVNVRSGFQVLENGGNRHARSLKNPRSAQLSTTGH
jgi:hypothetical protein